MQDLEKRLTTTLLNHLDAITHYWNIIRKERAIIAHLKYELKFFKKENRKAILVVKVSQEEVRILRAKIKELENKRERILN
jgi:hypothetical protein